MAKIHPLTRIDPFRFVRLDFLNKLAAASRNLVEPKGVVVSHLTTSKYLEALTASGFLRKQKIGRTNYYVNRPLYDILAGDAMQGGG